MSNLPSNIAVSRLWIFLLAVALPVTLMLMQGVDANWDLRNYHLYDPHAWLTGRMNIDIAPAQMQSWHNPLLDVPLYLIVMSGLNARWAGLWLLLPAIVSIMVLLRLQRLLSPRQPSWIAQAMLAVLALTGAATYSTLATSTNDGFVAAAMLTSLWLVLKDQRGCGDHRHWLLAGCLAGAAVGLKLTASLYCVGLAVSALVDGGPKEKIGRMFSLAAGGALGFVLAYGYWGWHLYSTHGNPFFPYYNNFFHSPDALAKTYADGRFRCRGLVAVLYSPIQLLRVSQLFSELPLRDPRLLLGLVSLPGLWLLYRKKFPEAPAYRRRVGMLLVFFVTSFLLWAAQYGIYRYAITLEMLACLGLVVLLQWLPRASELVLLGAAFLVNKDTIRPEWGHIHSAEPMAGIKAPAIPADSLVIVATNHPVGYLALGLPRNVPVVSVNNNLMAPDNCTQLQSRARQLILSHAGPIWLLTDGDAGGDSGASSQMMVYRQFALAASGACLSYENSLAPAQLCPQQRSSTIAPAPAPACVQQP